MADFRFDIIARDQYSSEVKELRRMLDDLRRSQTELQKTTFNAFSRAQIQSQTQAIQANAAGVAKLIAEYQVLSNSIGASGQSVSQLIAATTGLDREMKSAAASGRILSKSVSAAAMEDDFRRVEEAARRATAAKADFERSRATVGFSGGGAKLTLTPEQEALFSGAGGGVAASRAAIRGQITDVETLKARVLELKSAIQAAGQARGSQQFIVALQNQLRDAETQLNNFQKSATTAAAVVGTAIRDIAQDSGFMTRRIQQDMGSAADSINRLNVSAVQQMMNASKQGADIVERQAQRNISITRSNQAEIERITNRPMILGGGGAGVQQITATTSVFNQVGASIDDAEHKAAKFKNTLGLNRMGLLELEAAGVNTFQALASGMDPFHVAVMESAQVMGALVQGGLIPSSSIVTSLMSPITGLVAAIGALTASFTYLGYQQARTIQNAAEVRAQLILVGSGAEMSASQVKMWETTLREATGVSTDEAHEIAMAFAALIPTLGKSAVELGNLAAIAAKLPGAKTDEVIKKWAAAARQGVDGINKLSEELRANSERTRQQYSEQAKAGEVQKTVAEQTRDLKNAVEEQGGVIVRNSALWETMRNDMGLVGSSITWLIGKFTDLGSLVVRGPTQIPAEGGVTPRVPGGGVGAAVGGASATEFQSNLQAMIADAAGKGIKLGLGALSRSTEEQGRLYEAKVAEYTAKGISRGTAETLARRTVAPPGSSMHEKALANDLRDAAGRAIKAGSAEDKYLRENAARFKITRPMSYEPWHVEPEGARAMTMRPAGGAAAVERESEAQKETTRLAEQNLKTQNEINTLIKTRENLLKGVATAADEQQRSERQAAADTIELQLRSMHTPQEQEAHRLRMANLETQLQAAERAAAKDVNLRSEVTRVTKMMQDEITDYAQGAALNRSEFTRKETDATFQAAARVTQANISAQKAVTAAQMRELEIRRAGNSGDADKQLQDAKEKLAIKLKDENRSVEEIDGIRQEIARLEVQARQQSFQDFMRTKQNEIREAKGAADKINAIIEEMRQKAAQTYEAGTRDYKRSMEDITRLQIEATQRSIQDRVTEQNRAGQISQIELNAEKRKIDRQVTERLITQQQGLQQEAQLVQRRAQIQEEGLRKILNDENTNAEQRKTIEFEILQLKEQTAEKIEAINKRIADANERDLQRQMQGYKQFFSSIGSAAESYLEAALLKTSTFAEANRNLMRGVGRAALGLAGDIASKAVASGLGGKPGEGLSDVVSRLLLTALGINSAATTVNTAAVATNSATTTAAAASSATTSGISSIFKAIPFIGGFFQKGGVVPSAAGGMLVGGTAGGMLSVLHAREMVLPENISTRLQSMLTQNESNVFSPTFQYNANVTGYHPYSSRSSFEGMLRQHGGAMRSWAENLVKNR